MRADDFQCWEAVERPVEHHMAQEQRRLQRTADDILEPAATCKRAVHDDIRRAERGVHEHGDVELRCLGPERVEAFR